jgi:DNA-binding response OmpR family regulator
LPGCGPTPGGRCARALPPVILKQPSPPRGLPILLKVDSMSNEFSILVADRNRHVREFLQRELTAEGYRVWTAKDGGEVLTHIATEPGPDLLILDLEIPFAARLGLLEQIRKQNRLLPVVIHTFLTDYAGHQEMAGAEACIEKSGNMDQLKSVVREVLRSKYPLRFACAPEDGRQGTGAGSNSGRR